jgi:hypothetical protein
MRHIPRIRSARERGRGNLGKVKTKHVHPSLTWPGEPGFVSFRLFQAELSMILYTHSEDSSRLLYVQILDVKNDLWLKGRLGIHGA